MNSPIGQASKTIFKQPAFLIAFLVLLVAAVSINAATQFLKLHFKKEPVALAHPLDDVHTELPVTFPKWVCISKDQLSEDVEQELGTHQYIMRFYIRRNAIRPDELARFDGMDNHQRMDWLGELRKRYKGALDRNLISFAVTYYTGKADTVAHIPERCYTADGYEPTDSKTETWDVKTPQRPNGQLPVRYISFDDASAQVQAGVNPPRKNVAYFFHTNGIYTSESGEVRLKLQNLFAKYAYYAKVELMVQESDRNVAADAMRDFLSSALPEVEHCLPDWAEVEKMSKGNRG